MTVSYQYEVASSTGGGFTKLLFMWRGSLYKLIYRELLIFLVLFAALSTIYRHVFTASQREEFENIVKYCDGIINLIPLSFVLGFYVSYVAERWWKQYMAIPWPDKIMHSVALYVHGNDDYARVLRRSLMRYMNLSLILVLRSISSAVKRRFPTLDHVVDSGFMTDLELELFQSTPSVEFNTYWIPFTWFINLLNEARRNHRLPDSQGLKTIMEEFNEFRTKCGLLWSYDWVSIPLVYTQVVTLATYSFFAVALVGRQYIEGANDKKPLQIEIDSYLPLFTILQFFFFMGLLKVAEQLINPFGDDDEDFELNWLIDRHTKVSYLGVDTLMNKCPPLVKDIYFDADDLTLPYTEAAVSYKRKTYRGSVADMQVPEEKQTMFFPDISLELRKNGGVSLPTSRLSSASLAPHPTNNSPYERRQISESPEITPRLSRNLSETVIQFDDIPIEREQDHRTITDAVKILASKSLQNVAPKTVKKPFFGAGKITANLQPWPSATNIARYNAQNADMQLSPMPSVTLTTENSDAGFIPPRKSSLKVKHHSTNANTEEECDQFNQNQCQGIINSAFSQERISSTACCNVTKESDPCSNCCYENHGKNADGRYSDICKHSCIHKSVNRNVNVNSTSPRRHTSPKYLVQRPRSLGSCKKKGVRWKSFVVDDNGETKSRRRTVDSVPTAKKILAHSARCEQDLDTLNKHYLQVQFRKENTGSRTTSQETLVTDYQLQEQLSKKDSITEKNEDMSEC